jgi:hypothetical protein
VAVLAAVAAPLGLSFALADRGSAKPSIVARPGSPTSSASAAFKFADSQPVAFQCSRDGGAFVRCGSGRLASVLYGGLPAGAHTFKVRGVSGSR